MFFLNGVPIHIVLVGQKTQFCLSKLERTLCCGEFRFQIFVRLAAPVRARRRDICTRDHKRNRQAKFVTFLNIFYMLTNFFEILKLEKMPSADSICQ